MTNPNINFERWRGKIVPKIFGTSLDEVIRKEVHDFGTKLCFLEYTNEEPMIKEWKELRNVEHESAGRSFF